MVDNVVSSAFGHIGHVQPRGYPHHPEHRAAEAHAARALPPGPGEVGVPDVGIVQEAHVEEPLDGIVEVPGLPDGGPGQVPAPGDVRRPAGNDELLRPEVIGIRLGHRPCPLPGAQRDHAEEVRQDRVRGAVKVVGNLDDELGACCAPPVVDLLLRDEGPFQLGVEAGDSFLEIVHASSPW